LGYALARCVGNAAGFLADHWSRSPLHQPARDAAGFADLLSLDDVDGIVASFPRLPSFRLVKDGRPLEPSRYTRSARLGGRSVSDVGDIGRIYEEFRFGATIVLQGLHRTWLPLARFCRDLELELTHPAQANAYVTPPTARGLAVHYDTHDVFVLQLAGTKAWTVYEPVLELPLASQRWSSSMGSPDEPLLAVDLSPGDVLYIPRGFLHAARAQEGVSAHLTIGVSTFTWHDVLREALNGIDDEVEFRRPLPAGFAEHEEQLASDLGARLGHLRDWLEKVDTAEVARRMTRRFWSARTPVLAGHLRQLAEADRVDDRSKVRRRAGTVCAIEVVDDRLALLLGDRRIEMPAQLEPVVRRLAGGATLAVGELADQLDGASRRVLVARLVREGLLEVVDLD
jgi:lysine-specific demethylase/histidyl-hydroxylase NO66